MGDEGVVRVVRLFLFIARSKRKGEHGARVGGKKATHVTAALKKNASDLTLLDVGKTELKEPFAGVDVVLLAKKKSATSKERKTA